MLYLASLLHDLARWLSGRWTTHVERDSVELLCLRYGRMRTEFRAGTSVVLQDGKAVARYSEIERVELSQPGYEERTPVWRVNLLLRQGKRFLVGESTDEVNASVIGARIATATGCAVIVRPAFSEEPLEPSTQRGVTEFKVRLALYLVLFVILGVGYAFASLL